MAQPQQVVDPNVNPPPTEQELLEYRVKMDRLTSAFHEEVQVRGVNAYTKLIHELKITVCKYNSDLVEADKLAVLKSIKRHEQPTLQARLRGEGQSYSFQRTPSRFLSSTVRHSRYTQPSASYTWMQQMCPARWQISTTTWLSSKQRSAHPISLKSVHPSH